ncbi:MAG TPA: hypothetical protein VGQ11_01980 [Candidatus Acidoferrales bacterium]|nr:hypothetical protein [Candidatus Acidoferrales bacterium]
MTIQQERCRYRSASGRRCRNEASIGWNVCNKHGDFRNAYAAAEEIVSNRDRLDTAEGLHAVMDHVIRAQAATKLSPREATALMYSCQIKLYTLSRLAAERKKIFIAEEEDVWREKALAEAHHDKLNCVDASPDDDDEEEK